MVTSIWKRSILEYSNTILFLLRGWTGKKSAIVMLFSFVVLTPIVRMAKEIVARP